MVLSPGAVKTDAAGHLLNVVVTRLIERVPQHLVGVVGKVGRTICLVLDSLLQVGVLLSEGLDLLTKALVFGFQIARFFLEGSVLICGEAEAFAQDLSRAVFVDELLKLPEYARHFVPFFEYKAAGGHNQRDPAASAGDK